MENHVLLLVQPVETPPANRFEELHPKDEFELLHSHIVSGGCGGLKSLLVY